MKKSYYSISEQFTDIPSNERFRLHCHDQYEIFLFGEGDAKYVVEEKTYTLEPGDIIIIRKHEMHRIYHNSEVHYRRFILMVSPEFFQEHNCGDYEAQFLRPAVGTDNKIAAELVRSSGLYDAFLRYKKYSEEFTADRNSPVLVAAIIEILYLINKITRFSTADFTNGPIKAILLYLNNNYTKDVTLDMLADKFYLSKYHLCRAFHKATGLTVNEYIRRKRLVLTHELKDEGKSLTEAALTAGFHDYSSFYRAYVKEYGVSPRNDSGQYNPYEFQQ